MKERHINVWLLLVCPTLGTWPETKACALPGNRTSNPLVYRLALSPLSHTSQGCPRFLKNSHEKPQHRHTKHLFTLKNQGRGLMTTSAWTPTPQETPKPRAGTSSMEELALLQQPVTVAGMGRGS